MIIKNKMIAPEVRTMGRIIRRVLPYFKVSTFEFCNQGLSSMSGRGGKGMRYEQINIDRPSGSAVEGQLRLCVYRPLEQKESAPGVLWIHGGGYGLGKPEQDEGFIRHFVIEHGCTVVSPDYCLSVQAPYPAALEDCYLALGWLQSHSSELRVNQNQLMVGGDSAGGGLTAALTIYARDKGEVSIAYQMPLYPMIDDRMITKSSQNNDAPVWNTKSNETGWKLYLGSLYGTENVPPYAAPARLKDFSKLPPSFTFVGSIEPFCDETVVYMEQLKAAGIPAEYHVFDGCYHAFDIMASKSPQAKQARSLMMQSFAYAKTHYFAEQPQGIKEEM